MTTRVRVLLVDDHRDMAEMLADALAERGFDAAAAGSGAEALERLEREPFDVVVTDLRMQPVDGFAVLARSLALDPERPVILMTAFGAVESAIEAMRRGATHYLTKPFKIEELAIFLERGIEGSRSRREAAALRRTLRSQQPSPGLRGRSEVMRAVYDLVARVADAAVPVLITGETGTGKGVVAAALHASGPRSQAPFVAVNCAALPEALLESELFGHAKGAFTGATDVRPGIFAEAHGGTILLDEVAELALPLQAKLLRVLETGRVRLVGGTGERAVDVRVLAATHRDLHARAAQGLFREDLLYRLDVVGIELPPLRRRVDDIPDLAEHFLEQARARYPRSPVERFGRDALARLVEHPWPGNVRELAHVVERAVLLGRRAELGDEDLALRPAGASARPAFAGEVQPMRELQRAYAAWALEQCAGVRARAAERLGIDVKTLAKLLAAEEP